MESNIVFKLHPAIEQFVAARNKLREDYKAYGLNFTLDGKLVGDIGEVIAADLFGITLARSGSTAGIDGYAADGRSVQVKASGTKRGPAFRCVEQRAQHLLFLDLDFENLQGTVLYNGPEHYVTSLLPPIFTGQISLSRAKIIKANQSVKSGDRLLVKR